MIEIQKICSNCGDRGIGYSCKNCGESLSNAREVKVEEIEAQNYCPSCRERIKEGTKNCPECGEFISKTMKSSNRFNSNTYRTHSSGKNDTFLFVISALIPFVGFVAGAISLASDDEYKRQDGKTCITIAIVSTIIQTILIVILNGLAINSIQ